MAKESEDNILPVRVIDARAEDVIERYEVVGIIRSAREVKLSANIGGIVKNLMVDRGDKVSKGEIVAHLDDSQLILRLEEKKALLDKAITVRERIENEYTRKRYLFENKMMISESEMDKARLDFKIAQAEERLARISVSLLEEDLKDANIISPMDGLITELYVEEGEMISIGTKIAIVSDYTTFILGGGLSERDAVYVRSGSDALVIIDALGGISVNGVIRSIGIQSGDSFQSGSIPIEIEIIDKDNLILPGMVGKGVIKGRRRRNVIVLPENTIWKDSGREMVFVASEGRAVMHIVKLGQIHRDGVEIIDGIRGGEQVIIVEDRNIADGTRIKIIN